MSTYYEILLGILHPGRVFMLFPGQIPDIPQSGTAINKYRQGTKTKNKPGHMLS